MLQQNTTATLQPLRTAFGYPAYIAGRVSQIHKYKSTKVLKILKLVVLGMYGLYNTYIQPRAQL